MAKEVPLLESKGKYLSLDSEYKNGNYEYC